VNADEADARSSDIPQLGCTCESGAADTRQIGEIQMRGSQNVIRAHGSVSKYRIALVELAAGGKIGHLENVVIKQLVHKE